MNQRLFGIVILFGSVTLASSQTISERKNIEKLCGCYEVEFKYVETFSSDKIYKFHDRDEINGGLELILPLEVSDTKMILQHLLVITDSMIIKHWREDWTYENPIVFHYKGDRTWTKEQLTPGQVKGKWTQSVWEVSDAPRYQGISEWIHTDDKTFWQNTTDAPLPRREYSVRNDYNILRRTNRIILKNDGWQHEQDNQKIIRNHGTDNLLVEEKGINTYKRVNDSKCASAKAWWEKNKSYWINVRMAWEAYIASHSTIKLKATLDGKVMHQYLDELARDFATGKIKSSDIDIKIKATLERFTMSDE